MDGNGVAMVGPSLVNIVQVSLDRGKKGSIGKMPSFKGRFSEVQEKALSYYIYSLNY